MKYNVNNSADFVEAKYAQMPIIDDPDVTVTASGDEKKSDGFIDL